MIIFLFASFPEAVALDVDSVTAGTQGSLSQNEVILLSTCSGKSESVVAYSSRSLKSLYTSG
jgi:hypothetical protein